MGFSFDFSKGAYVVYTEEGRKLPNDQVLGIVRNNREYLIPLEIKCQQSGYVIYYDISGTTNIRAWLGEAAPESRKQIKGQLETVRQRLLARGIPKECLVTEEKYMYVDDTTGNIRLICIPLTEANKKIRMEAAEQPLPEIPPIPKDGLIFNEYMEHGKTGKKRIDRNRLEPELEEGFSAFEQWDGRESKEEDRMENRPIYEAVSDISREESLPAAESFTVREITSVQESFASKGEEEVDEEDGTVLLRDLEDDEGTVLLSALMPQNVTLVRLRTQEVFSINKRECKLGKKASRVDICLEGNPTISREHCIISYENDGFYIEDCASSNRTYLDGEPLMPHQKVKLEYGCKIRLSDEEFLFQRDDKA